MNKLTLRDIMESLASDDMDAAQSNLHEWFVDQSKKIHASLINEKYEKEGTEDTEGWYEFGDSDETEISEVAISSSSDAYKVMKAHFPKASDIDQINRKTFDQMVEKNPKGAVLRLGEYKAIQVGNIVYFCVSPENKVHESEEDLIAELAESFAGLETISDKLQNQEGAQVGEEGKVPVNTKSPLPNHKAKDRQGGEAVQIKNNQHDGFDLEDAPKVEMAPVEHHIQNSKDDPKKVTTPKGALLNKMDGSVNTQSPISGKGAKGLK